MWPPRYEMEIKDAIRTLAKEFYRNPSAFKTKADFKERFYRICLRKRPFKKKYKFCPLTGEKLSILKKDCPIYFAEKPSNKALPWSYDIAVLSPDLITRFDFRDPRLTSILKNDVVGLIAAIEFVFISEHSARTQKEVENSYTRFDAAHLPADTYIVAFSTSHQGNRQYFERTMQNAGSGAEPSIICVSVQQHNNGKRSMKWEQYPWPWFTVSKFKDRMERLDSYLYKNFGRKWDVCKNNRLDRRYHFVDAIKQNKVVGITGHPAVDRPSPIFSIQQRLRNERGVLLNGSAWVNLEDCEDADLPRHIEFIAGMFAAARHRGLSHDKRTRLEQKLHFNMERMSVQEKERLLRELIPPEKDVIFFANVSNDDIIRRLLGYMGHWHAVVISRKPIVQDLIDVSIHIRGRRQPAFIAKHLDKYLFGESSW